jgi:hypothetical protein
MDNPREGINADFRETDDIQHRQDMAAQLNTVTARNAALQADSSKIQKHDCKKYYNLYTYFYCILVHPEPNAFRNMNVACCESGIHIAAAADKMHLMYEGLGKAIHTWLCTVLISVGIFLFHL